METESNKERSPNPRQNANILSIATFSFTLPLFFKGRKKPLTVEDLPETWESHQTTKLANGIEAAWKHQKELAAKTKQTPSLFKALMKTHGYEFLLFGLLTAFNELVVKVVQPLALGEFINYYSPEQNEPVEDAYLYASGIVVCALLSVLINHPAILGVLHTGMKLRVACSTLIYRKTLKMNQNDFEEVSAGKIINLVANDVNRFDNLAPFVNGLWIGPLQTIIVTYFMYREVGVSAILGMVVFLALIPLQFLMGKLLADCRLRTAIKTDERVRIINEIISGIQVIKMYAWEKPYQKIVALTRRDEMKEIASASYIRGFFAALVALPSKIGVFATIVIYILFGNTVTARQMFVLTAYYNTMRSTMTLSFPLSIAMLAEVSVSIKRISEFLLCKFGDEASSNNCSKQDSKNDYIIEIENGGAKWKDTPILSNINIKIKSGSLVAVVGTVGSGKSSLFQVILKELPLLTGRLTINGKISYSSQQAWLFTGTVRKNILFSNSMDKLRYKAVVSKCALKTDFSVLPYADKTIVGERGVSLSGGQKARINLARAVYHDADIYLLDDPLSAVDPQVGKQLFKECISNFLREKTVILITHQVQYLNNVDHIIVMEDGRIKATGSYAELQTSGVDFTKVLGKTENVENEVSDSEVLRRRISVESAVSIAQELVPGVLDETKASGSISKKVYLNYIKGSESPFLVFLTIILFLGTQLTASVTDVFLMLWTNLEQSRIDSNYDDNTEPKVGGYFWDLTTETCLIIYAVLTLALILVVIFRSLCFFQVCLNASKMLYEHMSNCVLRAKLLFFNTNPSGRILNRFSNDIGLVDERLPFSLFLVLQLGLLLLAIIATVTVVNPWLLGVSAILLLLVYLMAVFYLKTSRNIKRVEAVTRSPVFAHINASIQGLPTIRAFNAAAILENEFDKHVDLHSSAWYTYISSSTAFGYYLDLLAVMFIGVVTFSCIVLGNEQYGGNVGLAISQVLILMGMFQITMKEMAEVENNMTSIERITEYTTLESEPPLESSPEHKPPKSWPNSGQIEFKNLFLKYSPQDPAVLNDLNFTIQPLEKVGIVGRTGAGKSSLIAALFRLADIEGSILIDQINTNDIGLHDLRSQIAIIPQEPVLFSGTMRRNLDPFTEYSDEVLWKALDEVELKGVVGNLNGGLETIIQEGGTNLSVGQRQLVCLARAIIRSNKILVLDEATANVDPQTDYLIQKTIRIKFEQCTVLTIAHRINTVMDSDKVLVMDAGRMVEFEHPHVLLQSGVGYFYNMVQGTSKGMSEMLAKIAKENYDARSQIKENKEIVTGL